MRRRFYVWQRHQHAPLRRHKQQSYNRRRANTGWIAGQRLRRCPTIDQVLVRRPVSAPHNVQLHWSAIYTSTPTCNAPYLYNMQVYTWKRNNGLIRLCFPFYVSYPTSIIHAPVFADLCVFYNNYNIIFWCASFLLPYEYNLEANISGCPKTVAVPCYRLSAKGWPSWSAGL